MTATQHPDSDATASDAAPEPVQRPRRIKSFVLRQGRITDAQQRAFELHWPRFGLDFNSELRDWSQVFGNANPVALEIGFGNGDQLVWGAQAEPQRNFIGVEVHRPGVGRVLNALAAANADNVRVDHFDSVEVLQQEIAAAAKHPDVVKRMTDVGAEPSGSTQAEMRAMLREQIAKVRPVVEELQLVVQ